MGLTADVLMRDSQSSSGYWDVVQDSLADLVRIMLLRFYDQKNHPQLYEHVRNLRGQVWLCAFPNLFITITAAEWKFPRPYFMQPYANCVFAGAYIMALHMYYLVRCMWMFLANKFGTKYFVVFEWVVKTEYQGRGTPHWHIAAWIVSFGLLSFLAGRTGTTVVSAFVKFLEVLFMCQIDVQIGNGRINYISGYVSKDHDAVDVGMGEYVQKDAMTSWLATFRLLSKGTPCIPEVAIKMAQLSEFERSYSHVLLYPPQPAAMLEYDGRRGNFSARMYGFYLEEQRRALAAGTPVSESFLVWHRTRQYDAVHQQLEYRGGKHNQTFQPTLVVACRYWYELTDGFWGQFALTQLPHQYAKELLPQDFQHLVCMQNFSGALEYLCSWQWKTEKLIQTSNGMVFDVSALPFSVDERGDIDPIAKYVEGAPVFDSDRSAFEYIKKIAERDLQHRGMRDDRISCFHYKAEANFLLYRKVRNCTDAAKYAYLQHCWDTINRPRYTSKKWGDKQQKALDIIDKGISYDDEDKKISSSRSLYIAGAPGSGKTAVLIEAAVSAARKGMRVLIICPTGQLVHALKTQLPDEEGIENIEVNTIHGVLQYKRPGADSKVKWSPPSALRRIDLILIDEASQYDDKEWIRLKQCIKEQPQSPFTAAVADFQQLQPLGTGKYCRQDCESMETQTLDTVYRTDDPDHLLFLNRIRCEQLPPALRCSGNPEPEHQSTGYGMGR